jgi:hypothetical protein
MALASVAYRAEVEKFVDSGAYPLEEIERNRQEVLQWVKASGLTGELERQELVFLKTPIRQASSRMKIDAEWRCEGAAVLAWALGAVELPAYDANIGTEMLLKRIGFLLPVSKQDLRRSGALRPATDIDRYASHATIVGWRLRQFRVSRDSELYQHAKESLPPGQTGIGEPMDFEAYLRAHPRFKESWLDGLRLIDKDLAIGDHPIAHAPPDEVKNCGSTAVERQIAVYWLQGDHKTYSKVNPVTFLSAC